MGVGEGGGLVRVGGMWQWSRSWGMTSRLLENHFYFGIKPFFHTQYFAHIPSIIPSLASKPLQTQHGLRHVAVPSNLISTFESISFYLSLSPLHCSLPPLSTSSILSDELLPGSEASYSRRFGILDDGFMEVKHF